LGGIAVGPDGTTEIVPVTGPAFTNLSCTQATTLSKPGFQFTFNGLCGYSGMISDIQENGLAGSLAQGFTFVAGAKLDMLHGNAAVSTLPDGSSITLSFDIPAGKADATFAVLYWDPSANGGSGDWVKQETTIVDGKLVVTVKTPGIFVMVEDTTSGQSSSQPYAADGGFYSTVMNWFSKIAQALGLN
jgi:hypothetical protein